MERLLVTGVDGPLGMNLALKLAEHFDVLGLHGERSVESPNLRTAEWRGNDAAQFASLARDWQPSWIIHCGPLAASSWDPSPAESAAAAEPRLVAQLVQAAAQVSARLTVMSGDAVFTGPRMFHEETSVPAGSAPHAAPLRAMEQALSTSEALVVRTHAYGWSPVAERACFAQRVVESLSGGTLTPMDGQRHATPILATDLAGLLLRAFEMRLHGLYHLAGAERTSPYRFVTELAAVFGLQIPAGRFETEPSASECLHDETSLSSKRARRELEMATPMLRDGLVRFAEQSQHGWREQYRSVSHAMREIAA